MCDSRFKQKIRTRLAFGITQIILKVYNSLKGKLACFANNSGSLHIHDFWKKYHEVHVSLRCTSNTKSLKETQKLPSALRLPSCELMVYIDIWLIHLQKEGISKHSWKKIMQLLWTAVEHGMLIVLMEFAYTRHIWIFQQF